MPAINWLESPEFQLTLNRHVNGARQIDILVIVEPDNGISAETAAIISKPPFNFTTGQRGFWVTKEFIQVDPANNGKTRLLLPEFARALKAAGIPVSVVSIDAAELVRRRDEAVNRDFLPFSKLSKFRREEAHLLAVNTQGEDVYVSKDGERAIVEDGHYRFASDATSTEDKKRFLLVGEINSNKIAIDVAFVQTFVNQQIQRLMKGSRWTLDDTVKSLVTLLDNNDVDQADNAIEVINDVHGGINEAMVKRYTGDLSEDSLETHGDIRALRIATDNFSRLLPILNGSGQPVAVHAAPSVLLTKSKYEKAGFGVHEYAAGAETNLTAALGQLEPGASLVVSYPVQSNILQAGDKGLLQQLQQDGEIFAAYDVLNSADISAQNYVRFVRVTKRSAGELTMVKRELPTSVMAVSQFSEVLSLLAVTLEAKDPLPFERQQLEDAIRDRDVQQLKEVPFQATTAYGTMPTNYVVPANLAMPQQKAMADFVARFQKDPAEYLAEKLQLPLDLIANVDTGIFSKIQIEHIALGISRYEDGYGFVIGDGTGVGKTRAMAAFMRYQALNGERIFFTTPDKSLLRNLWRELKLLQADKLIVPFVPTSEAIVDEDNQLVEFSNGETSENHRDKLKGLLGARKTIPGEYNAVFTTYSSISAAPTIKAVDEILGYNPSFDKPVNIKTLKKKVKNPDGSTATGKVAFARVYDKVLMFAKFCSHAETIFIADESHRAAGDSNTKDSVKLIKEQCDGRVFASATSIKNAARTEIYNEAMRVPMSNAQLVDVLKAGGETALEAFAASLTEEGAYVRAEMPRNEVRVRFHTDDAGTQRYEEINDAYAEIMSTYMLMVRYINKAKDAHFNKHLAFHDAERWKPRAADEISIGLNATGFTSRFTKTNELFVACLKSHYIAQEAIRVIASGEKAFIPLELTSETNIGYIAEIHGYPVFNEKQVNAGEVEQWIAQQLQVNPDFKGAQLKFTDVLGRMLEATRDVKVQEYDEENDDKITVTIDATTLVESVLPIHEIAEYQTAYAKFEQLLQSFPDLTASPYDYIINEIRKAGYTAEAYSGRHVEVRYSQTGVPYLASSNTRKVSLVREAFQRDEVDCVCVGRSGWTGVEWHAIREKPVNMIIPVPTTSADLEQQLVGRVNRTGQTHPPTMIYTSTGLLVEERLVQQAMQRMRNMNATSKGDANMDATGDEVKLFSPVGIEAVKRYLYNNHDVLGEVGYTPSDIESKFTGGASIATALTSRVQMLKTKRAKDIMRGIEAEYYMLINEMQEQGLDPFGSPVMDVEATHTSPLKIGGVENTDNPWNRPVYATVLQYSEKVKFQSSADLVKKIAESQGPRMELVNSDPSYQINALAGQARFVAFAQMMQRESDSTLKSLQAMSKVAIADLTEKDGGLFSMKERYERSAGMAALLKGMKLGQIVKMLENPSDPTKYVEGVVTDVVMERIGGTSPVLHIDVPGLDTKMCTATTVERFDIQQTPLMFSQKSAMAAKFDNQSLTYPVQRVALMGPAFPMITSANDILKAHNHSAVNGCKVVNMTMYAKDKGKYAEKVLLLPRDITMESLMTKGQPLNATEAVHYMAFVGKHIATLITASSHESMKDSDLTLKMLGTDSSGQRVVEIVAKRKSKEIIEDADFADLGVGPDGAGGFGNLSHTKSASLKVSGDNITKVLNILDEKYNKRFYCESYGLKFVSDFKNAKLPDDYLAWKKEAANSFLREIQEQLTEKIDVDAVLGQNSAMNHSASTMTI